MREKERFKVKQFVYDTGTPAFQVQGRMPDGKQVRKNVQTFHEALQVKEELELKARGQPVEFVLRKTRLTQEKLAEAEHVIRSLENAQKAHAHLKGKSLQFLVDFALANYKEPTTRRIVRNAFTEFKVAKSNTKRRPRTLDDYDTKLGSLVEKHGDTWVDEITTAQLEQLIDRTNEGSTQNHYRTMYATFFKWCRTKGYCSSNPAEGLEIAKFDQPDPAVLTLPQAKALLIAAQAYEGGVLLLYIVLGLFAGLRPAEIERLPWSLIDLKSKLIDISGKVAKRRKRRTVELSDNAVEWLIPLAGKSIFPKNFRRHFDAIRRSAGFKGSVSKKAGDDALLPWPHDVIRHTAISHHFSEHEHEGKTAKWAGQEPEVMHDHYRGRVTKEESKVFWNWTPTTIHDEATTCARLEDAAGRLSCQRQIPMTLGIRGRDVQAEMFGSKMACSAANQNRAVQPTNV